jgi:hypothetical protein
VSLFGINFGSQNTTGNIFPAKTFDGLSVLVNGSEPGTLIRWQTFKTGSWRGAKGNRAGHTGELFDRRVG